MFNNILPYASENVQIFMNNNYSPTTMFGGYGTATSDTYIWNKPNGIKMVNIFCVGGGGGGGLGATPDFAARGGGGGGGTGAIFTVTYPARILPNTLLVYPSPGGIPTNIRNGSSSGNFNTSVSFDDNATLVALAKTGGNGGDASGTTAGAGGAGGQSTTLGTDIEFARFGNFRSQIGLAGGTGGAGAAANIGGGFTVLATFCLTGGCGGGSVTSGSAPANGGSILAHASGLYPGVAGGLTAGVVNGNDGYTMFAPFVSTGGSGGAGGATSQDGGNGGNGGIGSGGGGSGAGRNSVNNYAWGGNGGPGMVIISCW